MLHASSVLGEIRERILRVYRWSGGKRTSAGGRSHSAVLSYSRAGDNNVGDENCVGSVRDRFRRGCPAAEHATHRIPSWGNQPETGNGARLFLAGVRFSFSAGMMSIFCISACGGVLPCAAKARDRRNKPETYRSIRVSSNRSPGFCRPELTDVRHLCVRGRKENILKCQWCPFESATGSFR